MAITVDYLYKGLTIKDAYCRISRLELWKSYSSNTNLFNLRIDIEISANKGGQAFDVKQVVKSQPTPFAGDILSTAYSYLLTLSENAAAKSV